MGSSMEEFVYIELRDTNWCGSSICTVCGRSFSENLVSAILYLSIDGAVHTAGQICHRCLDQGQNDAFRTLKERSEWYKSLAAMVKESENWMTVQELRDAESKREREIFGEMSEYDRRQEVTTT